MSWEKEPLPTESKHPAVWDLVLQDIAKPKFTHPAQFKIHGLFIEDIKQRDDFGEKKYKTRLRPFNGRMAVKDAYEEILDLIVYLRQSIYEEEQGTVVVTAESDFFKFGLQSIYNVILDSALKLRFILEKKKIQKEQNEKGKSPIDTGDGGNSQKLCDNKSNLVIL